MRRRTIPYAEIEAPGNPRHLVNMVQLDPEHEHYRDTIFHSVFGVSLVFDDIDHATEYRRKLVAKGHRPPVIFTTTGDRIAANGVLDPRGGRKPNELKFIFGEQNPCNTAEYTKIKSGEGDWALLFVILCDLNRCCLAAELDVLERLGRLIAQREEVVREMRGIPVEELHRRCQEIEAELQGFGVSFTQAP